MRLLQVLVTPLHQARNPEPINNPSDAKETQGTAVEATKQRSVQVEVMHSEQPQDRDTEDDCKGERFGSVSPTLRGERDHHHLIEVVRQHTRWWCHRLGGVAVGLLVWVLGTMLVLWRPRVGRGLQWQFRGSSPRFVLIEVAFIVCRRHREYG